jgi:hypothetical protein
MKHRVIGILFIILGGLIAFGPRTIFPVCDANLDMVMKCHWTARAELGIGFVIVLSGVLLTVIQSDRIRLGLSLGIILNGILSLLIPTVLIGVCGGQHMTCHSLTLPALAVISGIVIIAAAVYTLFLYNTNRKAQAQV